MKESAMRLWCVVLFVLLGVTQPASAQFPKAPVRMVVTSGAGGSPDVIARIVADALSEQWKQQVFVTNHPGAAGAIGIKVAAGANPDGYTLLFALSSSFVSLPEIAKDQAFDLVNDFVPVGFVCEQPMAIAVSAKLNVNTLEELINYAKGSSDQLNVAVLSRGSIPHLTSEWIAMQAGIKWTIVNYPGTPAGLSDVLGGRVQVIVDGLPSLKGAIDDGQLKLLAIGSAKRLPDRPQTPAINEIFPGIPKAVGFFAIMAPPGTPLTLANQMSASLRNVTSSNQFAKRLEDMASYVNPMSPDELRNYIRVEQENWKPVISKITTLKN